LAQAFSTRALGAGNRSVAPASCVSPAVAAMPAISSSFQAIVFLSCGLLASTKKALIIIDTQECFLESGSLPVVASQIIPKINQIRNQKDCLFDLVVKTQDYHPAGHISFGTAHGMAQETPNANKSNSWRGAATMKCLNDVGNGACCPAHYVDPASVTCNPPMEYCAPSGFYNATTNLMLKDNPACTTCKSTPASCFDMTMDLWLDHCLQGGDSEFATTMVSKSTDKVVQKGHRYVEMFSGFFDNSKTYNSSLHHTLQAEGITEVMVAGIATTHCVRWTVQDAVFLNYTTSVIMDASAGIWGTPTSYANESTAIASFQAQNITVLNTADILAMTCPGQAPAPAPTPTEASGAPMTSMMGPAALLVATTLASMWR